MITAASAWTDAAQAPVLSPESRELVRAQLARQHDRVRSVLLSAGLRRAKADELTELAVAVNQSLGVLSRAGIPAGELRSAVRAACAAASDTVNAREAAPPRRHSPQHSAVCLRQSRRPLRGAGGACLVHGRLG